MTLDEVIAVARAEGWRIQPPTLEARPICEGVEIVGFYCPHAAGHGRTRVGPIYVLPSHRGRGLAAQAYGWAPPDLPLVAYVHDDNPSSERLHVKAGFRRWRRGRGGWYMRRP